MALPSTFQLVFRLLLVTFVLLRFQQSTCFELPEREVVKRLLANYEPASRPVQFGNESLKASIKLVLQQVVDLDEKNQVFITSLLVQLKWLDHILHTRIKQLHWQSNMKQSVTTTKRQPRQEETSFILPVSKIWTPDLYVYNNADDGQNGNLNVPKSRARVDFNGEVTWNLPVTIRSSCNVDVLYFPFDHQICDIQLASWTYDKSQLELNLITVPKDLVLSQIIQNVELSVVNLKIEQLERPTVGDQIMSQVIMKIHIQRRALFYGYTVIAPSILLCVFTLFSFWLPSGNAKKIDMGLTVFLFLYFLQVMIAENTPESNTTPLIGMFLTMVMTLNSISLIFATTVLHIHLRSKCKPPTEPSPLFWYIIANLIGPLTMIPYKEDSNPNHAQDATTLNGVRWLYVARVLDRLLFNVYLIATIISIFVFLIYLPYSNEKQL